MNFITTTDQTWLYVKDLGLTTSDKPAGTDPAVFASTTQGLTEDLPKFLRV